MGSSSTHFTFDLRLKIARGLARGLTYIHEKKQVHGNIKPSNILLTPEIDAVISDLGLSRLLSSSAGPRHAATAHLHDVVHVSTAYSGTGPVSAYRAPESMENIAKPSPKWDVFSFGVVFLELLTGRVLSGRDSAQWAEREIADVTIRAEVAGREDAMLACLKLGFGCVSLVPQKRPSMKEVVQVLEKIP